MMFQIFLMLMMFFSIDNKPNQSNATERTFVPSDFIQQQTHHEDVKIFAIRESDRISSEHDIISL